MRLNLFRNKNFAVDLGNTNTLVSDKGGVRLSQPSYIVFNASDNTVKAVGDKAFNMYEKNHHELKPVKPMKGGVIADYDSATQMIRELIRQADNGASVLSGYDNIITGIPFYTTEVERRALRDAMDQFNARKTSLFYEPLAAALGIGLDIREPEGKMVIDIGGGITEIVVIS
ncbi:MAG TPA: rod shape-determining protein, partial [Ohtaekwangia sp.]|nr:rod shape-determining protein [Ohtaekwangia sp.]